MRESREIGLTSAVVLMRIHETNIRHMLPLSAILHMKMWREMGACRPRSVICPPFSVVAADTSATNGRP
eukprot:37308-Eustigmatos_ZCMA.PRE.1